MNTLRVHCFALGAWTVKHANRKVLKLALPVKKRQWIDGLFSKIETTPDVFYYSNA